MGIISSLGFKSYQAITTNTPTPSVMVTLSLLVVIFNYALQLELERRSTEIYFSRATVIKLLY